MTDRTTAKLQKKLKLLEEELSAIKSSRSYRVARASGVLKEKVKREPFNLSKKILSTILTDPRRLIRIAKGQETNTGLGSVITNRVAQYHTWIALNEPGEAELSVQKKISQRLKYKPKISILTPVFDPPIIVLQELLDSVLSQTYPYFELNLGNFGKSDQVKRLLDDYSDRDTRVKVYEFDQNLGIAGNSNLILEKVTGEFVALLDHDDTLSPDALHENVALLNNEKVDFIYSDKDMIDEQGNRYEPFFKADLCPETMLNANYLTHFDVMRTSLVRAVGGWDPNTDGAQDWDLFLKLMEKTDNIRHIPKILYHWRVIATSTAHSIETKPYALAGQRRAVQKYLDKKGIKAKTYHVRTELLLKWATEVVPASPVVLIKYNSLADTLNLLSGLLPVIPAQAKIIILHMGIMSEYDEELLRNANVEQFLSYEANTLAAVLNKLIVKKSLGSILFIDDNVRMPKDFNYVDFMGWLSIDEVGIVGAKILDRAGVVIDCGAILTPGGIKPVFKGFPSYYQGYQGNVEWVRNLHIVSRDFFAVDGKALMGVKLDEEISDELIQYDLMLKVNQNYRLLTTPKTSLIGTKDSYYGVDQSNMLPVINTVLEGEPIPGVDRYSSPHLDQVEPMMLSTDSLSVDTSQGDEIIDQYQHDALILSRTFDLTDDEINNNTKNLSHKLSHFAKVGWFLPSFEAIYAGLNNIFSFADYLLVKQNVQTYFFILSSEKTAEKEKALVVEKFPALKAAQFMTIHPHSVDKIPSIDVGICTLWSTAYTLAKCDRVKRKCYFIQDNEPNFYPMGSISAIAEFTYKLGFFAIANTEGLLDMYKNKYGGNGVVLKSLVSLEAYHPREYKYYTPKKPYRVFFYARPNMPRNAFELGLAGLSVLKKELGNDVEIITAGAAWEPADYGVNGIIKNLGKIPYDQVPEFYRSLDAGIMFMFSGHPGVTASELMASGCPVVVNEYDDTTWHDLYQHEKTSLVTLPTASEIARNIKRCLEENALRKNLIDGGLAKVTNFYDGYAHSQQLTYQAIKQGSSSKSTDNT